MTEDLETNIVPFDYAARDQMEGVILVYSYAGKNPAKATPFDFRQFKSNFLIWENRESIYYGALHRRRRSTLVAMEKKLKQLDLAINCLSEMAVKDVRDLPNHPAEVGVFLIDYVMRQGEHGRSIRYRTLARFMNLVGFPRSSLPPNPFPDDPPKGAGQISDVQAAKLLRSAKRDASVVRENLKDRERLRAAAFDPRRRYGGRTGDGKRPECGVFLIEHVFGLKLFPKSAAEFAALNTDIKILENCPGAREPDQPKGRGEGETTYQKGVRGAMRWFFPYPRDITPFIAILMARSGVNYSDIAPMNLKDRESWFEDFPLNVKASEEEEYKYFFTKKYRGRSDNFDDPTRIQTITPTRCSSYPYKIVETLIELTSELRTAIKSQITEYKDAEILAASDAKKLAYLETIQDDLFIYKIDGGVGSLAAQDEPPRWLLTAIKKYAATENAGTRSLRKTKLTFSYRLSGNHLYSITMLANHKSGLTSTIYERSQETKRAFGEMFADLFGKAIALIRLGSFSVPRLRQVLRSQGMTNAEIVALLDKDNTTRWGNRCSNPLDPPPPFNEGTPPGELCRLQNCIDGCSRARWLPSSKTIVQQRLDELRKRFSQLSAIAQVGSSLGRHIDHLEKLILEWTEVSD